MDSAIQQARSPGLPRRLAALFYDLMLLFGVLAIATAMVVIPYDLVSGGPFPHADLFHRLALRLYLAAVTILYFSYFWVRGGATLGMRSWRLRLVRADGSGLRARDALLRSAWAALCLAPAGIGLLWMLLDRDRMTCYDRLSRTRIVVLPRWPRPPSRPAARFDALGATRLGATTRGRRRGRAAVESRPPPGD